MESGSGFTLMHLDELEHPWPKWRLARKSLGIGSFGMNVCELAPGEAIPEHDETKGDQEEVYVVLRGEPTVVVEGTEHPAPEGTFIRFDPEPRRTIVNNGSQPALVLMVSAPRTSGYTHPDWA